MKQSEPPKRRKTGRGFLSPFFALGFFFELILYTLSALQMSRVCTTGGSV
jgi:hypothetical protein